MKKFSKKIYSSIDAFLCKNTLIGKVIHVQHRIFPLPVKIFDAIFQFKLTALLFNFYGSHVSSFSLHERKINWLDQGALYWQLWRQTDIHDQVIKEILAIDELGAYLADNSLTAVDIGFGTGKNYTKYFKNNNLKEYIGVEPNKYVCEYVKKKFGAIRNFTIINQSLRGLIDGGQCFDLLFAFGGVFKYVDEKTVDDFFNIARARGLKALIITLEGVSGDASSTQVNNYIYYNFKKKLLANGFSDKTFIEKFRQGNNKYEYLVMY